MCLKWFKIVAVVLLLCAVLSGCSFRLASSVDELISPVSPQGDDANVQNALTSYAKGGYTLKTPSSGEFKTAFSFYDIDGDSFEEAIVFYEPQQSPGKISMAVIDKSGENWSVIYSLENDYSDVYSLAFSDLNGDGSSEFIVLWDIISNSTNHILSVYTQNSAESYSLEPLGSDISVNSCLPVDMDLDGTDEMLAFTIETGDSVSASATLYKYSADGRETLGRTRLDGHISYYSEIKAQENDGRVYIYADAVKSSGTQMLTEVIYWSDYYNTIISPFYSYSTGVTSSTSRNSMINCTDIDADGVIEIPVDAEVPDLPSDVYAVEWTKYDSSVLTSACYSLAVIKDEYQIMIPDEYIDEIKVLYSSEESGLTVTDKNDETLFSVFCVLKAHYVENTSAYSQYSLIAESSGYLYFAQTGESGQDDFSADALKSMIRTNEGE